MRVRKTRLGAVVAVTALCAAMVGSMPASAAVSPSGTAAATTGLHDWAVVQPSHLPGAKDYSLQGVYGFPYIDAGLTRVQTNSSYVPSDPSLSADDERVQLLNGVTLGDVNAKLLDAVSGDPAKAGSAMSWYLVNTNWHSGGIGPVHMRIQIVENGGSNWYAVQVSPNVVNQPTASLPYSIRGGTTTATLPATSQTLTVQPNGTFALSTSGSIPKISTTVPLQVWNRFTSLAFAKFWLVPSTTTVAQAANWCQTNTGLSPTLAFGVGTMSPGVKVNADLTGLPTGRMIITDDLPGTSGISNRPNACKLVDVK